MCFARFSTDDTTGQIRGYSGSGRFTDDPLETFGGAGVVEIPGLQKLLHYICENGFEHHVAANFSSVAPAVHEACTFGHVSNQPGDERARAGAGDQRSATHLRKSETAAGTGGVVLGPHRAGARDDFTTGSSTAATVDNCPHLAAPQVLQERWFDLTKSDTCGVDLARRPTDDQALRRRCTEREYNSRR